MPTVPSYTQKVRNNPAPVVYGSANAPAAAFGAAGAEGAIRAGQKLDQTSDLLAQNAIKMQIEDNEREAKNADVELSARIRAITLGDGEKEGYYSTRGENAVGNFKLVSDEIQKAREEIGSKLTNPRVREMYSTSAVNRVEREMSTVTRHVAKERITAANTTSEARLGEAAADAAAHFGNAKVLAQSKVIIAAEVNQMAQRNGWTPEVAALKMKEGLTVMHQGVIKRMLVDDPAAAKGYFDTNKLQIDGRVHAEIEKAMELGNLRQQSQAETDRIYNSGLNETAQLAEARKIKDPKLRDETVDRLNKRFAETERQRRAGVRAATDDAWKVLKEGGSVDDIPPTTLSSLPLGAYTSMQSFEKRRAQTGNGYAKASRPGVMNSLHAAYIDGPAAFAEYDLTRHLGDLTERHYLYWQSQQRSVNRSAEKAAQKATSYTLADRMAKEYMKAAKIDYNSKKGNHAERAAKIFGQVRQVVDTMTEEDQRVTRQDIDTALKQLFLSGEVRVPGTIWNPDKERHEVVGTDEEKYFRITDLKDQLENVAQATGVPKDNLLAIEKALEAAGKPLTMLNIQRVWEAHNDGK